MADLQVQWIKCAEGARYCSLEAVDLSGVTVTGVYVIWQDASGVVVRVGQGNIKDRLTAHRSDPGILQHRGDGVLLVSWARLDNEEQRRRVERWLGRMYNPTIPTNAGDGPMMSVNMIE